MRSSENSRPAEPHAEIRPLCEKEICRALFLPFSRRQEVTRSLRKAGGEWLAAETPFIDDWDEKDYVFLVECLRRTVRTGGLVYAAFAAMGCVDAQEIDEAHARREPFDRPLECRL